jgi:hypothetical protein
LQTASECLEVVYPEETAILDHNFPFLVSIPSANKSTSHAPLCIPELPSEISLNLGGLSVWHARKRNSAIGFTAAYAKAIGLLKILFRTWISELLDGLEYQFGMI